jgi:hypothetical protein
MYTSLLCLLEVLSGLVEVKFHPTSLLFQFPESYHREKRMFVVEFDFSNQQQTKVEVTVEINLKTKLRVQVLYSLKEK